VIATLYSLYLGVQQEAKWEAVVGLYFLAFALDAVDGHVARMVGQESGFGGVLDMVTDRTATAGLVMINLLVEEEDWKRFGWICLCMLDIASHWFHCIAAAGRHHKSAEATAGKNFILRWYYACKPLFFACCIGQELFYLLNFVKEKGETLGSVSAPVWMHPEMKGYFPIDVLEGLWWVTMALAGIKQVVNVAQLASAAVNLAEEDAEKRSLMKKGGKNGGK
jgi:CDP-diacylglycerol--inositol 3-phosphatidyltransferase